MARTYTFSIGVAEAGMRLDLFLARRLPMSVSRAMIQRGIRAGAVTIGEQPVKVHYKLRHGDVVTAAFDQLPAAARDVPLLAQDIPLDIVYEDAALLVVNKPPGLVTHPAPGHWDGTLVNAILWHVQHTAHSTQHAAERDPQLQRAGIIHRLDKDTSGLLLIAKTAQAQLSLARQLKARTIHRRYLALVEGHLPLDTGTVDVPIGRHATHRKVMTVRHLGGRTAITHYRVVKRFNRALSTRHPAPSTQHSAALLYTLIDVSLETGRTHQIRVHVAHMGHPVIGDVTYGSHPAEFWQSIGVARQMLHAYRLSFQHPVTAKPLTVAAPVPSDMAPWVDRETTARLQAALVDQAAGGRR